MKKSLALLKLLKTGISLFIDIAMFIYLVITSALTSVVEGVNGTVTFALVIASPMFDIAYSGTFLIQSCSR